jgi:hypothetical protein
VQISSEISENILGEKIVFIQISGNFYPAMSRENEKQNLLLGPQKPSHRVDD